MPEEEQPNDKKADVVDPKDYNKVVEQHNSVKAENEELKKQIEEKKVEEAKSATEKVEADKTAWEKEKVEKDKMIEELKAKAEVKEDETKVSKGVVKEAQPEPVPGKTDEKVISALSERFPAADKDPSKIQSPIGRMKHYKTPTTKQYSSQQLGEAIALQAEFAQDQVRPDTVKPRKEDTIRIE